ncbi:hypothetical protein KL905_004075 [Ogataea polymorpha]|uniref:uncharacterized protein n=1 Tax=Ogataea polymorpha TaxID=460523 RepID=UPI0007F3D6F2|nr:uncharacterized protein OGAPODRAFT_48235 [Ogataea polymorpha]KAG7890527.1 hypothetical protein KL908_004364 [Ogataea polymorpha]KAG7907400.1 hypothetical protein KL906_004087 [Ogataea polymorpha]KAG7917996.1 hypothetical protein KL905_004075 [Ogataea polymorpha]KAG7932314.1 hypothetical protein KL934_003757 [Ogataea polymorpha]KAG7933620.1 hypothetical protein KL904_003880 [Ogataea polymorpha]
MAEVPPSSSVDASLESTPAPPLTDQAPVTYNCQPLTPQAKKAKYFAEGDKKPFNVQETATRFRYLLGLTSLFQHFLESKATSDPKFAEVWKLLKQEKTDTNRSGRDHRHRKTEKEEDAELLKDEELQSDNFEFTESPSYINGTLRPYQIQGLNWLISLNQNNLSGILADEMGLGKTLQTIAFLGYLRYIKGIAGPHLVIVPKSTLENWQREFTKWTPEVETLVLTGDQQQRNEIIKDGLMTCKFDVVISSYEIVIREKTALKKFAWEYIVVDEAHRLKNEDSLLSQIIRTFHSRNRLLITGTPLQNNLHELWALLNFLLPDVFADSETFDDWFSSGDSEKKDETIVNQLHKVLQPFLLRRIKSDVEKNLLPKKELNLYVGMTEMQKKWYQKLLERDIDAVNGANGKRESKTRLLNIVMQLRKCCNHPYLFEGAEPGPPYTTDEHLIYNSQKMKVLDKMLKRFKEQGSRVLIFSQMSRMLDILEDYCSFRGFEYCRIDGQTDHVDRIRAIDEYSAPDSKKFIFLLTTRAGGLGINLTSADIVFLYDSDWNPQADLQAMDRAHRIGQTKQVQVFRFVTQKAIEEKVLERASQKLRLDQLVIQQGRQMNVQQDKTKANSKDELLNMIQYGAADVLSQNLESSKEEEKEQLDDDEIDKILMESEKKTQELNNKYSKLGLDDLQNFTTASDSLYEWDGKTFQKKDPTVAGPLGNVYTWINPSKRERKENYSIDSYYRDVLNPGHRSGSAQPQFPGVKPLKQTPIYDHQFFPAQLWELYDLERNYYKRKTKQTAELAKGPGTAEQRKLNQQLEQLEIDHSRALTDEEEQLKQELLTQGFHNWSRRDFYQFISLNVKYGRTAVSSIAAEFEDKTYEEVKEYAQAFWNNIASIEGYERYVGQIEAGEEKIRKVKIQKEALRRKMAETSCPLLELTLKFPPSSSLSSSKRVFSEAEDRYLLVQLYRLGLDTEDVYERILEQIRLSPMFEFDFFFQSRNATEINRRCATLLGCVVKEYERSIPSKREPTAKAVGSAAKKSRRK